MSEQFFKDSREVVDEPRVWHDTWRTKWGPWGNLSDSKGHDEVVHYGPWWSKRRAWKVQHWISRFFCLGYLWGHCYIVSTLTSQCFCEHLSQVGRLECKWPNAHGWLWIGQLVSPSDWFSSVPFPASQLAQRWKETHQQSGRAWSTKTGNVLGASERSLCFICFPAWTRGLRLGSC